VLSANSGGYRETLCLPLPLPPVLRLRVRLRLPLHVRRVIGTAVRQRLDVVNHITWTRSGALASCGAGALMLEGVLCRSTPPNSAVAVALNDTISRSRS
jgi:sorbitol-specific phosphotransferase system component IIA